MIIQAEQNVYWINMSDDILRFSNKCPARESLLTANKQSASLPKETADYPFQKLAMDMFGLAEALI